MINKNFTLTVKELKSIRSELKNVLDKNKKRLYCYYFNRVLGEVVATDGMQLVVKQFPKIAIEGATVDDNLRLDAKIAWHLVKGRADNEEICFEQIETKKNDKREYIDFIAKIGDDVIELPNSCWYDSYSFPKYQPLLQEVREKCVNTMIINEEFTTKLTAMATKMNVFDESANNINIISASGSDDIYIGYKSHGLEVVLDKFKTPNKQELAFNFNCKFLTQALKTFKFDAIKYDTNDKPVYAKQGDVEYLLMPYVWWDEDVRQKAREDMATEHPTEQATEGCVFVNCYFTQSKWNKKNKKYQNYTAKLGKVNFKLENGKLALFKVRTGELIEDNISEAEILYNEETRKFIYTRKREGQRRLRIDFEENVFDAIRQGKTTKIKAKTTKDNKLHSAQRKTHKNGKKTVIIKFVKKMAAKIQNMAAAIVISGLNV